MVGLVDPHQKDESKIQASVTVSDRHFQVTTPPQKSVIPTKAGNQQRGLNAPASRPLPRRRKDGRLQLGDYIFMTKKAISAILASVVGY
jgi:hypothetical protein